MSICQHDLLATKIVDSLADDEVSTGDLADAIAAWNRGDIREALHQLENALGRDFRGLGDLTPEQLK